LQIAVADDLCRTIEEEAGRTEATLSVMAGVLSDESIPAEVRVAFPTALVSRDPSVDHLAVFDAEGELIDVARTDAAAGVEIASTLDAETRAAATAAGVHVGRVRASGGEPRLPVTVPIVAHGAPTGFVHVLARVAGVQARVERIHDAQLAASEGLLYVVDDELRVVAHPDLELVHQRASYARRAILHGVDPSTLRAGVPRTSEVEIDGRQIVGTVVGLDARPWAVVVEVPRDVAYASLDEMRRIVIVSVALAALLALLAAFFVAGRITAPIASLARFARDLAARRFDRRVEVRTSDELEMLADAMSGAARDLEASEAQIREEERIRADLGRYLPAEIVDKVVSSEQDMGLGGVRREITVLFADVVAFTPLTERLPPEEVVSLLNELFTVLTELVFRHQGTVDKFVGDCVMAVWGAPSARDDHAARALECAEDMMSWLSTANPGWEEKYGVTVQLAIGVHSGEAIVGNVGSERRMEYTAIGDVVNVAARLEAIARPMQILVSEETRSAAGDAFDFADIGDRVLSGRQDPVRLFEVRS
jgi:class 3 adenylate cyclase